MTDNETNEPILAWLEERGGGYVWEPDVFAVTMLDVSIGDDDAERLSALVGVQQIAVDASRMSLEGLKKLAGISGIESLVVRSDHLTHVDIEQLRSICPEVQIIDQLEDRNWPKVPVKEPINVLQLGAPKCPKAAAPDEDRRSGRSMSGMEQLFAVQNVNFGAERKDRSRPQAAVN